MRAIDFGRISFHALKFLSSVSSGMAAMSVAELKLPGSTTDIIPATQASISLGVLFRSRRNSF